MVRLRDLSFSYGDRPVFERLSLEFEPGFHAVIGPNGSGKTTLLKIVSGVLKPDGGEIEIYGKNLEGLKRSKISKLVTLISQDYRAVFDYTVLDVVLMGRIPHSLFPDGRDVEIVLEILESLGLKDLSSRRFESLSGGERRLVLIAKALAQDTPLILVDELELHLDPRHKLEMVEILKRTVEMGKTVISVFHDLNLALNSSDRIVGLKDGRVLFDLESNSDEIPDALEGLYGVRFRGYISEGRWCVLPEF